MADMVTEALNTIAVLDGMVDDVVVGNTLNRERLTEFVAGLRDIRDALGLESDLYYGEDFEDMPELVETVIGAAKSEYYDLEAAELDGSVIHRLLDGLRDAIRVAADDEELNEELCEFAAIVGLWASEFTDDDISEVFELLNVVDEDEHWEEDDSESDEDASVWERV